MRFTKMIASAAAIGALGLATSASATSLRVTITNNAPNGGAYITPVWTAFHNGSFDTFSIGDSASAGLEAIAEDGNVGPLSDLFAASAAGGVQGVTGAAPIAPGQTVSQIFNVADDGSNNYFSYASMVLPSSDYFIGNGDPTVHNLAKLLDGTLSEIVLNVGTPGRVYDAGTEVNDFDTSAGNGLFANIPGGQMGPNQGADENGVVQGVFGTDAYADFLSAAGIDTSLLNFLDLDLYNKGLATIRIEVVPVPAALPLFMAALGALGFVKRRQA
ncbi:MAG: spondin domain-containing protein [Gammaproteobacteria bacterium]